MGTIGFGILGPLEVTRDGAPLSVGPHKQRVLLTALLLQVGHTVSTDGLVAALWADQPPARPLVSLRVYVSNLRRILGDGSEPSPSLLTGAGGYFLRILPEQLDAAVFEVLAEQGRRQLDHGDAASARETFVEALGLWRGEPLADVAFEDFAQGAIARLNELRVLAEENHVEALLALGRSGEAVAEVERLLSDHPLRERLRAQMMIGCYRSGHQARAIATYTEYRDLLAGELGLDPSPELQRLHGAILAQAPSLDASLRLTATGPVSGVPLRARPPVLVRPGPPLVGRERELVLLDEVLAEASSERGAAVVIEGEAGIGKTRVLERLAEMGGQRGFSVHWGRCYEGEGTPAFWPWIEIIRSLAACLQPPELQAAVAWHATELASLLPSLATQLSVETMEPWYEDPLVKFRMGDAIGGFLGRVSERRPLLLLLDDLHWADSPSLAALQHLLPMASRRHLVVAVAYRDDGPVQSDLANALAELARSPRASRMALEGLDLEALQALFLEERGEPPSPTIVDALHRRTRGNPFFVGELLRLTSDDRELVASDPAVPLGVRDVVLQRLARLPAEVRETLMLASCERDWFRADILALARGLDPDTVGEHIDAAVAARLVVEDPADAGVVRFHHALVREALHGSMTARRRAAIHAALGRAALDVRSRGIPVPVEELARHFQLGAALGTAEEGIRFSREAAGEASRRLACSEGAQHLARALDILERHRPGEVMTRIDVLTDRGWMLQHAGEPGEAHQPLLEAASLAQQLGDVNRMARACIVLGGTYWGGWHRFGEPNRPLLEALDELVARADELAPHLRVATLGRYAVELYFTNRVGERRRAATEAVALARQLGEPKDLAQALIADHLARWSADDVSRRLVVADGIVAAGELVWPHDLLAVGLHFRATDRLEAGDAAGSAEDFHRLEEVVETFRLMGMGIHVAWGRAMRAQLAGNLDAAVVLSREAVALHERIDREDARLTELSFRFRTAVLGVGASPMVEELRRVVAEAPTATVSGWRTWLGLALVDAGEQEEAAGLLDEILGLRIPRDMRWLQVLSDLSELAGMLDSRVAADRLREELQPYAGRLATPGTGEYVVGSVDHALGILHRTCGDLPEAARSFAAAVAQHERIEAPLLAARSRAALAALSGHEPRLAPA